MKSRIVAVLTKDDVAALSKPGCTTCLNSGYLVTKRGHELCLCLGSITEMEKRHEERTRKG